MSEIDNIIPKEKWQFGRDVAECFPNMLERSIPGYVQMRELTFAVGEKYLRKDGKISNIVDIGCSNGLSIYPFLQKYGARIRSFLVDNSDAMIEAVN
jgi:tRNA (cmo5U34)-methyltransferase